MEQEFKGKISQLIKTLSEDEILNQVTIMVGEMNIEPHTKWWKVIEHSVRDYFELPIPEEWTEEEIKAIGNMDWDITFSTDLLLDCTSMLPEQDRDKFKECIEVILDKNFKR
jgi:hypothetical protein